MAQIRFRILHGIIVSLFITMTNVMCVQEGEWVGSRTTKLTEGDTKCFSEYMEMWIDRVRFEGLVKWLSEALQLQFNVESLDLLNLQLSACGYSLHKDPDNNFIFRVSYNGCFVQQQHGLHVLRGNLVKRGHGRGSKRQSLLLTCPQVLFLPNRETIQCDPENIQVVRQIPHDNWNNELQWSLSLSDRLVVAMEDASLIQINVVVNGSDIAVQGRMRDILSPVKVMGDDGELLALKLVSGQYAYSMEAVCSQVSSSLAEQTVLHIFKRHPGLSRRGGADLQGLTLVHVQLNQTDNFSVNETSDFVSLIIPTNQILQSKACPDNRQLLQPFYRVDVVLTFKETNHKMHWSMENTWPCTAGPAESHLTHSPAPNVTLLSTLHFTNTSLTTEREFMR